MKQRFFLKDLQPVVAEVRDHNVPAIGHDCNAFWERQLSVSAAFGPSLLNELTARGQDLQTMITHISNHKITCDIDSQSPGM